MIELKRTLVLFKEMILWQRQLRSAYWIFNNNFPVSHPVKLFFSNNVGLTVLFAPSASTPPITRFSPENFTSVGSAVIKRR
jgi:hypothetical protein